MRERWLWRLKLLAAMALFVIPPALLVNHIVPQPYMDEIFHVPQAQSYCRGDFSKWDPNITTFPGLYYASLGQAAIILPAMKVLGISSSLPDLCTVAYLRSTNVLLFLACGLLLYEVLLQLDPEKRTIMAFAKTIVLSLYPLHWFFTFLYYTDMGATAAVMGAYLACLKKAYWISALLAVVAILFRQTNAVWTVVILFIGVSDCLLQQSLSTTSVGEKKQDYTFGMRRRQFDAEEDIYLTKNNLRKRSCADGEKDQKVSFSSKTTESTSMDPADSWLQGPI